jgi:hypothetical protein
VTGCNGALRFKSEFALELKLLDANGRFFPRNLLDPLRTLLDEDDAVDADIEMCLPGMDLEVAVEDRIAETI